MNDTLVLMPPRSLRQPTPVGQAEVSPSCLASQRGTIATWRDRIRVRWELAQMARGNPHLIDDIGLTRQQVEAEIAKPFWRR